MIIDNSNLMRNLIYVFIALLTISCAFDDEKNLTQAYFLSPHSLGRTPQVDEALNKITSQIRVKQTTYNHSAITYVLNNVVIGTAYNDGKQNSSIPKTELVKITGGRIQFTYKFNYTKIENRNNVTGYAYGSVLSDPLTYYKQVCFINGYLGWKLPDGTGIQNLTLIENRMKIKRMEPFNQTDLQNMEDMLDKVFSSIDPANFEVQILEIFNQIFPLALNESLNHQTFGQKINYTFHSNTHGEMKMNIIRQVWQFGCKNETGFFVRFFTKIQNFTDSVCNVTAPLKPYTFDVYGGSQNFHMHCFYQTVISYVQTNGWLDTVLNDGWETNAFQFYAGDLFDLINNLHLSFSPRSIVDGNCAAQKQGLRFSANRDFDANSYTLDVTYKCSARANNNEGSTTQILKFTSNNKFYIKPQATIKSLSFKIILAEIVNLSFEPVGNYYVSNLNLALFKANQAMKLLANIYTFGTGFPTIVRQNPKTNVNKDFTLYYDNSHIGQIA